MLAILHCFHTQPRGRTEGALPARTAACRRGRWRSAPNRTKGPRCRPGAVHSQVQSTTSPGRSRASVANGTSRCQAALGSTRCRARREARSSKKKSISLRGGPRQYHPPVSTGRRTRSSDRATPHGSSSGSGRATAGGKTTRVYGIRHHFGAFFFAYFTGPRRHAATPPRRHAATPPRRRAAAHTSCDVLVMVLKCGACFLFPLLLLDEIVPRTQRLYIVKLAHLQSHARFAFLFFPCVFGF